MFNVSNSTSFRQRIILIALACALSCLGICSLFLRTNLFRKAFSAAKDFRTLQFPNPNPHSLSNHIKLTSINSSAEKETKMNTPSASSSSSPFETQAQDQPIIARENDTFMLNDPFICWKGWCDWFIPNSSCQCTSDCAEKGNCCSSYLAACATNVGSQVIIDHRGLPVELDAPKFRSIGKDFVEIDIADNTICYYEECKLFMATEADSYKWIEIPLIAEQSRGLLYFPLMPGIRHHFKYETKNGKMISKPASCIAGSFCTVIVQLEEEITLPFLIESVRHKSDYVIVIDTGSKDLSLVMVEELFKEDIKAGKVIIHKLGDLKGEMGIARSLGIDEAKRLDCRFFIAAEADSIYFDAGIEKLSILARTLPAINYLSVDWLDTYQNVHKTTADLFNAIASKNDDIANLRRQRNILSGAYLMASKNAVARGKYSDEAQGRRAETIYYPKDNDLRGLNSYHKISFVCHAHFSQLRPLEKKEARYRLMGIPLEPIYNWSVIDKWKYALIRLHLAELPETLHRMIETVRDLYNTLNEDQQQSGHAQAFYSLKN